MNLYLTINHTFNQNILWSLVLGHVYNGSSLLAGKSQGFKSPSVRLCQILILASHWSSLTNENRPLSACCQPEHHLLRQRQLNQCTSHCTKFSLLNFLLPFVDMNKDEILAGKISLLKQTNKQLTLHLGSWTGPGVGNWQTVKCLVIKSGTWN